MLKKMIIKKIVLISAAFFAIGLLYLIPEKETLNFIKEVEYIDDSLKGTIYLLNNENYLGKTEITISSNEINIKAKELLEGLIENNEKIPNKFKGIIPMDTKINSVNYNDGLIKVDFSKELLELDIKNEEKAIEAIVYTLTSINEIKNIIIYVDGEILTKLPKSKINLPSTLDRTYGINKEYDINDYKNIDKVTIYYLNKDNYYVPVTKYFNGKKDKIKLIIDELSTSYIYNSNLMSYLNSNAKLLNVEQELDTLFLVFNEYIFNDMNTENILEEVMYSISMSINDSYNIENIAFVVNNKEICKTALKTLEK